MIIGNLGAESGTSPSASLSASRVRWWLALARRRNNSIHSQILHHLPIMIGCLCAAETRHGQTRIHERYRRLDERSHSILRRERRKRLVPERERIPQIFQNLLFGLNLVRPVRRPGESCADWRGLPENCAKEHEIRRRYVLHFQGERPHSLVFTVGGRE